MGRCISLWIYLNALPSSCPLSCTKRVNIPLLREQELEKADASIPASLIDAQQHQVIAQPWLPHHANRTFAVIGELLNRVLGAVVVPGYAVVSSEGEQFVLMPDQPLAQCYRYLRMEGFLRERLEKLGYSTRVSLEMPSPQAMMVYGRYN